MYATCSTNVILLDQITLTAGLLVEKYVPPNIVMLHFPNFYVPNIPVRSLYLYYLFCYPAKPLHSRLHVGAVVHVTGQEWSNKCAEEFNRCSSIYCCAPSNGSSDKAQQTQR